MRTAEAANRIGITVRRLYQLIAEGKLEAKKVGRDWVLTERKVDQFKRRPVGRPRKEGRQ